ncbi:hypothetical protein lerEdw1_003949 [Lerista edwardsae]|nr:hypothetical protein lerEdw1_003949 [Lerista edwardsae]
MPAFAFPVSPVERFGAASELLRCLPPLGYISVKEIVKPAVRAAWISQQVDLAKKQYMDGINIDIEQDVIKASAEYFALTALVKETTDAFHKEIPGSQVTFDVAWSPECIDLRCYNYTGIADSCDFVFVMSYDEQSQVWSDCIARANAPYNQTLAGYDDYLHLGISPKKLVMGVPWYGYDYTCLNLSKAHTCSIEKISFRGAPCSDAAGRQVPYRIIMNRVNSSLSGILWNEEQKAPYLEYNDSHRVLHQVWFDDPTSISLKAAYVKERGLRGIGTTSVKKIVKPAFRASWIRHQVKLAKKQHMDGINIDIEQDLSKASAEYFALTALVNETTDSFHKKIPGSQVTFDVPWSPECFDSRCYNYSGIADSCDFLFVMSYDEPSQVWSECTVTGTAPYNQTVAGYADYFNLGISPKKLVMGVPWYGYDYVCLHSSPGHICHFANVPSGGAQCRFSAGHQVPYGVLMNEAINSISGIQWDETQRVSHFEYKDSQGTLHQIWFDDPKSISLKAAYVKERGLRGIGMWNGNCLNYSGTPVAQEQTKAMWEALKPE